MSTQPPDDSTKDKPPDPNSTAVVPISTALRRFDALASPPHSTVYPALPAPLSQLPDTTVQSASDGSQTPLYPAIQFDNLDPQTPSRALALPSGSVTTSTLDRVKRKALSKSDDSLNSRSSDEDSHLSKSVSDTVSPERKRDRLKTTDTPPKTVQIPESSSSLITLSPNRPSSSSSSTDDISDLKAKLVLHFQQVIRHTQELQQATHKVQTNKTQKEIEILNEQIKAHQTEYNQLHSALSAAARREFILNKEKGALQATLDATFQLQSEASSKLLDQLKASEDEKLALRNSTDKYIRDVITHYSIELENAKTTIDLYNKAAVAEIHRLHTVNQTLQLELSEVQTDAERLAQTKAIQASDSDQLLNDKLSVLQTDIETLQDRLKETSHENSNLKFRLDQAEKDNSEIHIVVSEKDRQLTRLQTSLTDEQLKFVNLESKFKHAEKYQKEVEIEVQDLQTKLDEKEVYIIDLNTQLDNVNSKLSYSQKDAADSLDTIQDLRKQLSTASFTTTSFASTLNTANAAASSSFESQDVDTLRTQLTSVSHDRDHIHDSFQKLQDNYKELYSRFETASDSLKTRDAQLLQANSRLRDLHNRQMTGQPADISQMIAERLSVLNIKDEVKAIPFYNGYANDVLVTDWLRDAEAVATIHEWEPSQQKKYIASRLKGPALTWHIRRLQAHPSTDPPEDYATWKKAFEENFSHPSDPDKLKLKLANLKQRPDQQTKHFIAQIETLYGHVYGNSKSTDPERAKLRNDKLLEIFMKGVQPKIRDAMWNGQLPADFDWDKATNAAKNAEKLLVARELNEQKSVNILAPTEEAIAIELTQSKKELELLKEQMNTLLSNNPGLASQDSSLNNIAVEDRRRSGRNHSNYVHFRDNDYRRSRSRDRFYHNRRDNSRDTGRDSSAQRYPNRSFDRSRSRDRDRSNSRGRYYNKDRRPSDQPYDHNRSRSQSNHRDSSRRDSYPRSDSPHPVQSREDKLNITCHRCERVGHKANECRTSYKKIAKFQKQN